MENTLGNLLEDQLQLNRRNSTKVGQALGIAKSLLYTNLDLDAVEEIEELITLLNNIEL